MKPDFSKHVAIIHPDLALSDEIKAKLPTVHCYVPSPIEMDLFKSVLGTDFWNKENVYLVPVDGMIFKGRYPEK